MNSVLTSVICAFGAGVLGSAMGALPAIIMCCFAACLGMVGATCGSAFNWFFVAFNFPFGPQVCFAPACAAVTYAWKKGYIKDSRDLMTPMISINHYDVLIVSGLMAIAGHFIHSALTVILNGKMDPVTASIVVICLLGRLLFGGDGIRGIVGVCPEGQKRFSPKTRIAWLPYMSFSSSANLALMGIGVGAVAGICAQQLMELSVSTGNEAIAGIAAMPVWALVVVYDFVICGGFGIPVLHHIAMIAGSVAKCVYLGGGSPLACVLWAVAFGLVGAYLADFLGRLFTAHGQGYCDPPSLAIAPCSVLYLWILPALGLTNAGNPLFWILPVALIVLFLCVAVMQHRIAKEDQTAPSNL